MSELLAVKGISKDFGPNRVLDQVSFSLFSGEVLCLVGENGAGKSTLIKILSGAQNPTEGEIIIEGAVYTSLMPKQSMNLGIYTIYQDVELIDTLTVADNIFLGREMHRNGIIDEKKQFIEAEKILDDLNIRIDAHVLVEELSSAQKQMLQIAKAVNDKAKVLIMDEPTSSLGKDETEALIKFVFDLRKKDLGIIYISHYIEEVFIVADRIMVLKDGHHVGTYKQSEVDENSIIEKMVGRNASMFYQRESATIGDNKLEVINMSKSGVVYDVSFSVAEGEIFGIGGLVGAGRSDLAYMLFVAEKKDKG